ncbi:MAG: EAL domain-containing protein [Eubacterium sp.]
MLAVASEESKLHEIEVMTWFSVMKIFKRDLESFGDTKIFINSISNQFLAEEELKVFEELYAPLLNRIAIEMSEEENINEDVACCKQTAAKKWKAAITIENLGIHYEENTSLQYIAPKYVKVDMSIVQNINQGENWKNLLRNNINYFQNKNIQVIAEGIETPEELKILVEMGVDYVQGYYLSIPQEIPPRLKQNQRDELLELSGISNEQEK